jgi:nitroimidazol reductase NimA-like FMN-containing flavoprotein (pyridoxamine 5'-phosphate oxidase superfamily)
MSELPICEKSQWAAARICEFLEAQKIPIRLCCKRADGYPLVCSMWYAFDGKHLWCAVNENALLRKLLAQDNKVAFEVAPNEMPYRGVRGHGDAELVRADAADVLVRLLQRYEIDENSRLSKWLLGRKDREYAIKITPKFLTAWDYSQRMSR